MKLYKKDEFIYYDFETGNPDDKSYGNNLKVNFFDQGSDIVKIVINIKSGHDYDQILTRRIAAEDIQDREGNAYGSTLEEVIFGFNKGTDTNWTDLTDDVIIARFNKVTNSTTLSVAGEINDSSITLTSVTGEAAGKYIILFHPGSKRFTPFFQVGAAVGNVITLDGPLDFAYPAGTFVDLATTNLAVDGSSTPQVFGLRGTGTPPGVELTFHLTRIIISCLCETAVSLAKFGDLAALLRGIIFRSRNNTYHNLFNIRSNREIDAIFGTDWKPYITTNPGQGQNGFTARVTFTGPDKMGRTVDLPIGKDVEAIVQDDLSSAQSTAQITLLEIIAEGHIKER